jgi:acetylornithine deacetylase/succinyl-diaminopimelate desuccinylase-like protein
MTAVAAYPWPSPHAVRRLASGRQWAAIKTSLDDGFGDFIRRTIELAEIPAPTFGEATRAAWVAASMRAIGLADVQIDDDQNVVGLLPGAEPGLLVAAHTDTVFAADADHRVRTADGRLYGRGIGDNSIGVTAMLEVARFLRCEGETQRAVWFAASIAEEGLGDLRGVRAVTDRLDGRFGAFVAVEGHFLGEVCTTGVGSRRWRITLSGPGGHSWHAYGTPSAIHGLGDLIEQLAALRLTRRPRTTLNIGRIGGGEGVNVIAPSAWLELDLRSERREALDRWTERVQTLTTEVATRHRLQCDMTVIGDRPAGSIPREHPLVRVAAATLRAVAIEPRFEAASTESREDHFRFHSASYALGTVLI